MHLNRAPASASLRASALLAAGVACLALLAGCAGRTPEAEPLATVTSVDLERYAGRWYEIARLPNRFQRRCVSDTTAEYARNNDGTLAVANRCRLSDGRIDEARAVARVADPQTRAKLEVSFFSLWGWRPVWGNYWIVALGPGYEYAVVGEPGRRYGWILSRTPMLPAATRAEIDQWLRELGYEPERFEDTVHTTQAGE